mmetsp:Transcript_16389/g.24156  ORF Transcript_16389/g.24156 Transcript_16389/m.24156 type:complete len:89 (+) Transcript_16389:107-373(+)
MDPHSTPPRKKQATDESSWQELSSVVSCTRKIHDCLDDSIEKTEVEIEKVMKPSPWTKKKHGDLSSNERRSFHRRMPCHYGSIRNYGI